MKSTENKTKDVKIRLTEEEKESLNSLAVDAGMSMSDFVRSIIFSKDKLICLTEGKEISAMLCQIYSDLEHFKSNGGIPDAAVTAVTDALDEISHKLFLLTEHLTDIHSQD